MLRVMGGGVRQTPGPTMADLVKCIPTVRSAVASILRIRLTKVRAKKKRPASVKVSAALAGSAFCIVRDEFLVTAHHLFNDGKPRDPADRFYAFVVPQNDDKAHHFPVTGFPLEDPAHDLAVLELGCCSEPNVHIEPLPVTFAPQPDGERVITVGFPAPEIAALYVNENGDYKGGSFFLKSHANEGIVSARYDLGGLPVYELNVGWHHGESGGPIARLSDPVAGLLHHAAVSGRQIPPRDSCRTSSWVGSQSD